MILDIIAILIIAIVVPPVAVYSYFYFAPKNRQPSFTLNEKIHAEMMLKLRQIEGVFENYGHADALSNEKLTMIKAIIDPYHSLSDPNE